LVGDYPCLGASRSSTLYAARHFAVKTDVTDLFPPDLPWTQRAFEYMRASAAALSALISRDCRSIN